MKRLLAVLLLLTNGPAFGAEPPRPSIDNFKALPFATMAPYDEKADAKEVVDATFARARISHKRVLLDLGGNWCPDCLVLANFMRLPEIQRFVAAHYEVAMIDVGRFDKNLDIPARFGLKKRLAGVPAVLVVAPDGKLLNRADIFALADAASMTPAALSAFLARWAD
jgi:thiol-disulfide isomerase/thioredoxin